MWNRIINLFTAKKKPEIVATPEIQVTALPLETNPGPAVKIKRAAARCVTLMDAIAQTTDEEKKKELRRSLATYQAQLVAAGYDVPESREEALQLSNKDVK